MIRISGRNLSPNKQARFALSPIKGIGKKNVKVLLSLIYKELSKDKDFKQTWLEFYNSKLGDYSDSTIVLIRNIIESEFKVETELGKEQLANIKHYKDIKSWRGERHKKRLPARGQRTKTNSRTIRGNVRATKGSKR